VRRASGIFRVFGVAGQEVKGVAQEREDGFKRCDGSARAAGQVEDEGLAEGSAEGAAERGVGGLGKTGGAHALGDAAEEAVADGAGSLGSDVAGADSGSAGGDDEAGARGGGTECVFDGFALVWY
jgi:hypothetical protein